MRRHFCRVLRIDPRSKGKLYRQIYDSAEIMSASYALDLIFAAGIATLGLVLNSPAVVIGAMLISPLMGPILASGLAFAASDVYLGVKSFLGLAGSIVAAVLFSAGVVWLLPFHSPTSEILARTQPNLLDLGVAIFSGLAGSVVIARSLSGGPASALPGVAIAVALMPPLCTVGFGIGSGWNWPIISGAGLLFLTNLVAISASAFFIFYLVDMDATGARDSISEDEMRHATGARLYRLLHDTAFGKLFGDVGQLRWRIAMMAVTIAVLFFPLRTSLVRLRDETQNRTAAREVIRSLVPADRLLSQQLEIQSGRLVEHLVTTAPLSKDKLVAAEGELSRRTGKQASIDVRQVANQDDLIALRQSLLLQEAPLPPPPPVVTLTSISASALPMLDAPVKTLWPSDTAELTGSELGFSKDGPVVRLSYRAPKAFDKITQEALRNGLRSALNTANLTAIFEWQGVPKKAPKVAKKK